MTNDEHIKRLDQIAKQIRALSDAVKLRILALIAEGVPERKAVRQVMAGFSDEFIVLFTAEFSLRIGREITVLQAKKLKVGKVTLSQRLSINSVEASATVQRLVREHVKGFQDARKLARTLYEGYGFTDADLKLQGKLPKYLLKNLDKSLAKSLKTPALRSAYLLAINQLESGAGKAALEKSLQIAVFEKNRYIANRIAQHELSLAHHNGEAVKLMDRDDVHIVQFRLSGTHPVRDICNLYAEQDRYGLGKGIYPKAFAPVPPIHPFCRCNIHTRLDLTGKKPVFHPASERTYLRKLSKPEQGRVMGSKDKAAQVLSGRDSLKVMNKGRPKEYRIRAVGEV